MSEEKNAGASYLAGLKSTSPVPGSAALPARPHPSEKRRSPRYRCQGSAHLRGIESGVATWATFTDISLHGVYVEAMSTFRTGEELSLKIEVNGYRVEGVGEVRVVYPGLGMGISFLTMSDVDRETLRQLLRSLSQPSVILTPRVSQETVAAANPSVPSVRDPAAALKAIQDFFEGRHILSRDEFFRVLKKSQAAGL